jgi:hypothetical protein
VKHTQQCIASVVGGDDDGNQRGGGHLRID